MTLHFVKHKVSSTTQLFKLLTIKKLSVDDNKIVSDNS